jgi:hypothetical protein
VVDLVITTSVAVVVPSGAVPEFAVRVVESTPDVPELNQGDAAKLLLCKTKFDLCGSKRIFGQLDPR